MSVVVAIQEGGKIYLGADSQVTKGGTRTTLKNPNNYKIWKVINSNNYAWNNKSLYINKYIKYINIYIFLYLSLKKSNLIF